MIVFSSRTGNVRHVINQLGLPSVELTKELILHEPFLLFTYTDLLGEIPHAVRLFLEQSHTYCQGVIASGNSNFGHNVFCGAADKIHQLYNIPIVRKIELRGFTPDYRAIQDAYHVLIASKEPNR